MKRVHKGRAARLRTFASTMRKPSRSPWPSRVGLFIVVLAVLLFMALAVRSVRRHDSLTAWRHALEVAAGSPSWPLWSNEWPALPAPPRRQHIPQDLHGVYAFAAQNKEVLKRIPCYCGCVREGHTSNLSCFVSGFRADGAPVWTDHSFSCPMCVHIAQEVMLMSKQGLPVDRIRKEIEVHYGTEGPSTNTPVVKESSDRSGEEFR